MVFLSEPSVHQDDAAPKYLNVQIDGNLLIPHLHPELRSLFKTDVKPYQYFDPARQIWLLRTPTSPAIIISPHNSPNSVLFAGEDVSCGQSMPQSSPPDSFSPPAPPASIPSSASHSAGPSARTMVTSPTVAPPTTPKKRRLPPPSPSTLHASAATPSNRRNASVSPSKKRRENEPGAIQKLMTVQRILILFIQEVLGRSILGLERTGRW